MIRGSPEKAMEFPPSLEYILNVRGGVDKGSALKAVGFPPSWEYILNVREGVDWDLSLAAPIH